MFFEVAGFVFLIAVIGIAYAASLWTLYRHYSGFVRHGSTVGGGGSDGGVGGGGSDASQPRAFDTPLVALTTIYWAFFGFSPQTSADVVLPEYTVRLDAERNRTVYNQHRFTELVGYFIFGLFFFTCFILFINMLIAMMSDSFSAVQSRADVEWKFMRTAVWMSFLDRGNALPPPFNLVAAPVFAVWKLFRWCGHRRRAAEDGTSSKHWRPVFSWSRCCHYETDPRADVESAVADEAAYQRLVSRLIQRHFTKKSDTKTRKKPAVVATLTAADSGGRGVGWGAERQSFAVVKETNVFGTELDVVKDQLKELAVMMKRIQVKVNPPSYGELVTLGSSAV